MQSGLQKPAYITAYSSLKGTRDRHHFRIEETQAQRGREPPLRQRKGSQTSAYEFSWLQTYTLLSTVWQLPLTRVPIIAQYCRGLIQRLSKVALERRLAIKAHGQQSLTASASVSPPYFPHSISSKIFMEISMNVSWHWHSARICRYKNYQPRKAELIFKR